MHLEHVEDCLHSLLGLCPSSQVGVQHALTIAARHRLPVVPVHHMEAHALMTRQPSVNPHPTTFPALILLVSGGHNMLVLSEGIGRHRILGTTLDDRCVGGLDDRCVGGLDDRCVGGLDDRCVGGVWEGINTREEEGLVNG